MDAKIFWLMIGLCVGTIIILVFEVHEINKSLSYLKGQVECMIRSKKNDEK